jgi:hypothetical protein
MAPFRKPKFLLLSIVLLFAQLPSLYSLKYYCELADESRWDEVKNFSNVVVIPVKYSTLQEKQLTQQSMQHAVDLGFYIIPKMEIGFENVAGWPSEISNFYDTIEPYAAHCVATYLFDKPGFAALQNGYSRDEAVDLIKQFCIMYHDEGKRRNINIPGLITYGGKKELTTLWNIPDELDIIGFPGYFNPTAAVADDVQRNRYEGTVGEEIKEFKAIHWSRGRPLILIGQSFDNGTGMPSAEQQQWYIDDVRNDPQFIGLIWYNWENTRTKTELVNAHQNFGTQLTNIGVHNVSVSVEGTTITIRWETNLPCDSGVVEYGTSTYYGKTVYDLTPSSINHIVRISDISEGDVIYYKITSIKSGYVPGPYTGWVGVGSGELTGLVKDESGNVISAGVIIYLLPGNYAGAVDSSGRYTIKNIPPGEYTAVAVFSGKKIKKDVKIIHNFTQTLDFIFTLVSEELTNGGFETGDLTGWFPIGDINSARDVYKSGNFNIYSQEGKYFLANIVSSDTINGYLLQRVKTLPGNRLTLSAYIYTDSYTNDVVFSTDNYCRIGIDPYGNTSPQQSSVVWSEKGYGFRSWTELSVSTIAQREIITIYLELSQPKAHGYNVTAIDNVRLEVQPWKDITPPPAPTLISPAPSAKIFSIPINFVWSEVKDAYEQSQPVKYHLQIDDKSNFSSPEIDILDLTTSSYTFTLGPDSINLLPNGRYWWRVRAQDSAAPPNYSLWSDTRTFIVEIIDTSSPTAPGKPVINNGAKTAPPNTTELHIKWAPAEDRESGISGYYLTLFTITSSGKEDYLLYETNVMKTKTEYIFTGLNLVPGATYYAMVRAKNGAGMKGPYSEVSDGIYILAEKEKPIIKQTFLHELSPNIFNPVKGGKVKIKYDIADPGENVTIKIYDVAGNEVCSLINEEFHTSNTYIKDWDGRDNSGKVVSSGVYILLMKTSSKTQMQRIIVIK